MRGDLSAANLLSGLAKQFGEGSGGPRRDYGNPKMAELDYDKSFEPHGPVPLADPEVSSIHRRKAPDENLTDQSWRRIDADWMAIAADLAMQLDRGINNTSLVLAFEAIDTGRVFLFPGDAQVGNWLSWQVAKWPVGQASVEATNLMARTVYLKVAHHGSQNATPEKRGLDLMESADLSAFIPTNQKDALRVRWGEMPYHAILTKLAGKTHGRVIRADDEWIGRKNGKPGFACPSGSILAVRNAGRVPARNEGGLRVELDLA